MANTKKELPALIAFIDGATGGGNPGKTGIGVSIQRADGLVVDELSKYTGRGTNNTAEWKALIEALKWASQRGDTPLLVRSDSKLVVQQMNGRWRVKDRRLQVLRAEARELAESLPYFEISWIPREKNKRADLLAGYGARAA